MALTAAELRVIVEAVGTREARAELDRTGQAVDQTGQRSQRAGAMTQAAGRAFVAGTTAMGAGFTAAVQEAANFEQQLATVNTVARLSEQDTARLGDALQQMSRDTGISTEELTQSMYDMVSAGTITGEQLSTDLAGSMETVNNAAMLAIGGMGDIAGTTDVLTSALNAYGMEASKAGEVTDIMAVAIERGKVTADEIGASLSNVAPMAANAGIELEEISAAYATLTANGVPAAEATTQMRAAIVALLSPNERLKDIMADTGINFAQVAEEEGLTVALQMLRDATDEAGEAMARVGSSGSLGEFNRALAENQEALGLTNSEMENLMNVAGADGVAAAMAEMNKMVSAGEAGLSDALGRVEGFNFMLQTTGENATAFGENLDAAMDAAGTASEQAGIAMEGPAEQAKRLAANVMTWMQDIGGPAASSLGPFLLAMNQLGPAMMLPIRMGTALGGAIGALAGKLILNGVPAVMSFGTSLAKGVVFMAGFTGALIKDGLTALGNFIIRLGAAGLAVLRFGTTLVVNAVRSVVTFATTMIAQGIAAVGQFIARMAIATGVAIAGFVSALVTTAVPALIGFASTIFTTAIPAVIALLAPFLPIIAIIGVVVAVVGGLFLAWQNNFLGIRDIAATVWNAITGFIKGAIDLITGAIRGFLSFLSGIWNGVTEKASGVWQAVTGVISGAVSTITGIIGGIADVARGVWDTVSGIFGSITDAAGQVGNAVGGAWDFATGWIPSFAEGTMDTGKGGLAMLHPHEMVIPKDMADAIRGSVEGRRAGLGTGVQDNRQFTVVVQGPSRGITEQGAVDQMRRIAALV